jgi:hypothetical protein
VKRVFISHPFSSDPEGNRVRVDIICHDLVKQGILPISSLHLFSFMENDDPERRNTPGMFQAY